ncbi:MAG TPA: DUF3596 domain-containing protein [Steroidobacteraceae bacterium]|nr:DUF3596 domain-containing protein [Steroidobacteraceae bacterium]
MGRPSSTGGVSARSSNGIQYDFMLEGVRYRPTLKQVPTEANLRRAREHLKAIKERIRLGTFSFAEEFPDFRDLQAHQSLPLAQVQSSVR